MALRFLCLHKGIQSAYSVVSVFLGSVKSQITTRGKLYMQVKGPLAQNVPK